MMKIPVRFTDIDSQGHANHTAILGMMAEARIALLDAHCTPGVDHVMVHIEADFIKPVYHPSSVYVDANVVAVGKTSVTTKISMFDREGIDHAKAKCINVFFHEEDRSPASVPETLEQLATLLDLAQSLTNEVKV